MATYTDAATIAAYLATTFTPEQAAQADTAAVAVTTWIDHRTGRTWQTPATVLDEQQAIIAASTIYLNQHPVVSVEAVAVKAPGNKPWTPLDPSQYALTDPTNGIVTVDPQPSNSTAQVSYTWAASGAPADLAYAATALAADILHGTLNPDLRGVESIAVGQNDISLTLASSAGAVAALAAGPWSAVRIIDAYRRIVVA